MRKFRYILGTCIIGICAITASAFAYFNFSNHSSEDKNASTDSDYVNNIEFDENSTIDPDRTYILYFFASPYYATGTSEIPSTSENPKDIAESDDSNPYNVQQEYKIAGSTLSDDATKFANITWSEENITYGNYISADVSTSDDTTTISAYNKRDFTGYIQYIPNNNTSKSASVQIGVNGIEGDDVYNEYINSYKVYSYLKATIKGGLKQDFLKKIIAQTEYKDKYGFGPEFMGWTYNKEECFKRATYSVNDTTIRYVNNEFGTDYEMYSFDKKTGKATSEVVDQIGNFGDNSSIDLLSADDSLYEIDHKGVDGTQKSDNIIYLYPVFGDRNEIKDTSSFNMPILRMLTNPDTDESSDTYYKYSQKGCVDYDYDENNTCGRYTNYLDYSEQTYTSTTTSGLIPNYTLKDFYVDMYATDSDNNNVNHYYLDVMLTDDSNNYTNEWVTIFNDSLLSSLNFSDDYYKTYEGIFDIDIIFVQGELPFTSFSSFKNPQLYINTPSINSLKDDSGNIIAQFVIGIKRDNSLKFTGLTDYNSIFDYNGDSGLKHDPYLYKTSFTLEEGNDSSYWHYFVSNPIEISYNYYNSSYSKFSIMIKEALELKLNHDIDQFRDMTTSVIGSFNDYLDTTDEINKTYFIRPFYNDGKSTNKNGLKVEVGREDTTINNETITNFPYLKAEIGNTFEFLFAIKYENGFPKQFQVAYREYSDVCNLLILSEKPDVNSDDKYLYSDIMTRYENSILLKGEFSINGIISKDTKFEGTKFSTADKNQDSSKKLYDLATGKDVRSLIQNSEFILSRNMILYYGD